MTRTARIEGRVQIGIMLLMGGVAGAASFKHIHDLAVHYGQPSLIGWANAIVVELMSIVAGLEIRRRKRTGQSAGFVYLVFFCAVLISLAAQVAKAHASGWGWIMAALPALGFLAVVKIVLTRQPADAGPDQTADNSAGPVRAPDRTHDLHSQPPMTALGGADQTGPDRARPDRTIAAEATGASSLTTRTGPSTRMSPADLVNQAPGGAIRTSGSGLDRSTIGPHQRDQPLTDRTTGGGDSSTEQVDPRLEPQVSPRSPVGAGPRRNKPGPDRDRTGVDLLDSVLDRSVRDKLHPVRRSGPDRDLLELGTTIAAKVAERKDKLTRQVLIDEIRAEGGTIGTDRASELLQWLKEGNMPSAVSNSAGVST